VKKWRLGLDVDQVLIDSTPSFVKTNNKFFGTNIVEEEYMERWGGTRWKTGYSEAEWERKQGIEWLNYAKEIGFYKNLPAVPGARKALETLAGIGAEFVIVTSRRSSFKDDTLLNLSNLFPNTNFRKEDCFCAGIYDGDTVPLMQGAEFTKGTMVADIGVAMFVDDRIEHALSMLDHKVPSIWFGEHHQEELGHDETTGFYRGRDWEETVRIVRRVLEL
jgi:5'(3')-deoxyribonucleotidase